MARRLVLFALVVLALASVLFVPTLRRLLRSWESNAVLRGRVIAERSGCFNCHVRLGPDELPNPGSRWGTVPKLAAGNATMYASSREELEEFIRFGAPREWLADDSVAARLDSQHLRMPAYDDRLTDAEIGDLVAYVAALEGVRPPEQRSEGFAIARRHGCLACHGLEGSGGLPNPGSLGGFIPGFLGDNFEHLVRGEDEFREWVLEGESSRLARNPLLRYFWRRQAISMPAYREELTSAEVGELWAWVVALRGESEPRSGSAAAVAPNLFGLPPAKASVRQREADSRIGIPWKSRGRFSVVGLSRQRRELESRPIG